ncbi:exodeoxyribonuclease VII small subunit [Coxiella endosymbiont of Ornithodoros maritimus]|uniref:exodeoxyribonuclease VII small subunit n=1 Tax=Coxiella endosymbiont of Ornithodoros maritimus TaxID=1656172 RepID=UPI002264F9D5|nr:exodeoxyribonuclease VII small subunit [Coxiella endosymbiont of Ornithodoros maritimus]
MPRRKTENLNFEASLNELTTLVEKLEKGNLTLAESLENFERGVALVRSCQQALSEAEQKVKVLINQDGIETLVPFELETKTD